MTTNELVPGIRIVYNIGFSSIEAKFYVDIGSPRSETFVTSPKIRNLINSGIYKNAKEGIGWMILKYDPLTMIGKWYQLYPHNYLVEIENLEKGMKHGLGEELEKRVLERIKHEFPQLRKLVHVTSISDERIAQLNKRGISEEELYFGGYSFRRAKRTLSKKNQRDKRKAAGIIRR